MLIEVVNYSNFAGCGQEIRPPQELSLHCAQEKGI